VKKVYKSKQGETAMTGLYDRQLKSLNMAYEELFAQTRFGKTHVIKSGNPNGKPVLMFHGGNSTTPYNLAGFAALLDKFCVYAADTIGHPGKSAQTVLSAKTTEYGDWAADLIDGLGFQKMACIGGSYGGGILVKLMYAAPEKIEKSVLIVPSGIANMSAFNVMVKMGVPMLLYTLTKKDYWLKRAILPMAIVAENIDESTVEMVKASFDHAVVKAGMPSNAQSDKLKLCTAPVLLIAAENDCLFPGGKVIERAEKLLPRVKTVLLRNQGHLCVLPENVMDMISDFIAD
jgi:pimeloyl-ACP methyl ester carboxylesterase